MSKELPEWLEESCNNIDSAFFSGDSFHSEEAVERIRWYLTRWNNELDAIEQDLMVVVHCEDEASG